MRRIAIAGACALAFAGCGGGGDTSTTSTGSVSTTSTATRSNPGEPSAVRRRFDRAVRRALIDDQGLSRSQADCAIEILDEQVTDRQLEAAAAEQERAGEPPQDLIDTAFEAGVACAVR